MELADWSHAGAPGIAAATAVLTKDLTVQNVQTVLAAARTAMRTESPGSDRWRMARSRLDVLAGHGSDSAAVRLYLGMMLLAEAGGKPTAAAMEQFRLALRLPAAHYFSALADLAEGKVAPAQAKLKKAGSEAPPVMMGMGPGAPDGNERLHPASMTSGEWPELVRAASLIELGQTRAAIVAMEHLLAYDPARPEAFALLADACAKAADAPDATPAAKADAASKAQLARLEAEKLFRFNPAARRDYEAVLSEARTGVWSGIPRP
jgi:predicted Zn-dependent protease